MTSTSRTRIDRRHLAKLMGAAVFTGLYGCNHPKNQSNTDGQLKIRTMPRRVQLFALSRRLPDQDLRRAVELLTPLKMASYPVGYSLHVLRVWGPNAVFPEIQFPRVDLKHHWGGTVLRSLQDNEAFRSLTNNRAGDLLVSSEFGAQARCKSDGGFAWQFTAAHPGDFVQVMAEVGVPASQPIVAADRKEYVLADVIRDEALRATSFGELEWVVGGLAKYLDSPSWINRFNQTVSFDILTAELLNRSALGEGVCNACHIPYTLGLLADEGMSQLLGKQTRSAVEDTLRDYMQTLAESQHEDGSWGANWAKTGSRFEAPLWDEPTLERVSVTGHILEVMSIIPPRLRLPEANLYRAARQLFVLLRASESYRNDWHFHAPFSHAVKALLGLSGFWFATEAI